MRHMRVLKVEANIERRSENQSLATDDTDKSVPEPGHYYGLMK
jgi:hypothetical protein